MSYKELDLMHEGFRGKIIAEIASHIPKIGELKLNNPIAMQPDSDVPELIEELTFNDKGNAEFMVRTFCAGEPIGDELAPGEMSTETLLLVLQEAENTDLSLQ